MSDSIKVAKPGKAKAKGDAVKEAKSKRAPAARATVVPRKLTPTPRPAHTQHEREWSSDSSSESEEEIIVVPQRRGFRRPARIPDSPEAVTSAPRMVLDSVVIPVSRPRRHAPRPSIRETSLPPTSDRTEESSLVADQLANLSLHPAPSEETIDHLLAVCSESSIKSFADIHVLLCDTDAGATVTKVGEASYSEVFGVTRSDGTDAVVVKVIPLTPACTSTNPGETPDCSAPGDVMREIEITKTLSGLAEGGFVDFKR